LRDKVLHWGHGFSKPFPAPEDIDWSLKEAKKILFMIDEWLGLKPIKEDFS
jgi:hypothetical protein